MAARVRDPPDSCRRLAYMEKTSAKEDRSVASQLLLRSLQQRELSAPLRLCFSCSAKWFGPWCGTIHVVGELPLLLPFLISVIANLLLDGTFKLFDLFTGDMHHAGKDSLAAPADLLLERAKSAGGAVALTLPMLVETGCLRATDPLTADWPEDETVGRVLPAAAKVKADILSLYDQRKPYELQWLLWRAASHFGFSAYQDPVTNDIVAVAVPQSTEGHPFIVAKAHQHVHNRMSRSQILKEQDLHPFQSRNAVNHFNTLSMDEASHWVELSGSPSTSSSSSSTSEHWTLGHPSNTDAPEVHISGPAEPVNSVQRGYALTPPLTVTELPEDQSRELCRLPSYVQAHQMNLEANLRGRTCYKDPVTGCLVLASAFLSRFSSCGGEFCKHCPHGGLCRRGADVMSDSVSTDASSQPSGSGWWSSSDSSVSIGFLDGMDDGVVTTTGVRRALYFAFPSSSLALGSRRDRQLLGAPLSSLSAMRTRGAASPLHMVYILLSLTFLRLPPCVWASREKQPHPISPRDFYLSHDPLAAAFSGTDVRVALLDTGLDDHFVGASRNNHGTLSASILGGNVFDPTSVGPESAPVYLGVAPNSSLLVVRIFDEAHQSSPAVVARGLDATRSWGAKVINLSFSSDHYGEAVVTQRVERLVASGVLVVAAAGNGGPELGTVSHPAAAPGVIGVGSTRAVCSPDCPSHTTNFYRNCCTETVSIFSGRGPTTWELPLGTGRSKPELVAIGERVRGLRRYVREREAWVAGEATGTSVAAPVVSGAVALCIEALRRDAGVLLAAINLALTDLEREQRHSAEWARDTAPVPAGRPLRRSLERLSMVLRYSRWSQGAGSLDIGAALRRAQRWRRGDATVAFPPAIAAAPALTAMAGGWSGRWRRTSFPLGPPHLANLPAAPGAVSVSPPLGSLRLGCVAANGAITLANDAAARAAADAVQVGVDLYPTHDGLCWTAAVLAAVSSGAFFARLPDCPRAILSGEMHLVPLGLRLPFAYEVVHPPAKRDRLLWDTVRPGAHPHTSGALLYLYLRRELHLAVDYFSLLPAAAAGVANPLADSSRRRALEGSGFLVLMDSERQLSRSFRAALLGAMRRGALHIIVVGDWSKAGREATSLSELTAAASLPQGTRGASTLNNFLEEIARDSPLRHTILDGVMERLEPPHPAAVGRSVGWLRGAGAVTVSALAKSAPASNADSQWFVAACSLPGASRYQGWTQRRNATAHAGEAPVTPDWVRAGAGAASWKTFGFMSLPAAEPRFRPRVAVFTDPGCLSTSDSRVRDLVNEFLAAYPASLHHGSDSYEVFLRLVERREGAASTACLEVFKELLYTAYTGDSQWFCGADLDDIQRVERMEEPSQLVVQSSSPGPSKLSAEREPAGPATLGAWVKALSPPPSNGRPPGREWADCRKGSTAVALMLTPAIWWRGTPQRHRCEHTASPSPQQRCRYTLFRGSFTVRDGRRGSDGRASALYSTAPPTSAASEPRITNGRAETSSRWWCLHSDETRRDKYVRTLRQGAAILGQQCYLLFFSPFFFLAGLHLVLAAASELQEDTAPRQSSSYCHSPRSLKSSGTAAQRRRENEAPGPTSSSFPVWLRRGLSLVGNTGPVASAAGSSSLLVPGDSFRSFPFFVSNSEVAFFCTHANLCEEIFGLAHKQRVKCGAGPLAGRDATVVGARGGQLWLAADGERTCRPLSTPPGACRHSSLAAAFTERYQLTGLPGSTAASFAEAARRAEATACRQLSAQQRAFLQRAPDLFVQMVKHDDDGSLPSYAVYAAQAPEERSIVLLTPSVAPSSGVLGWVGEDSVMSLHHSLENRTCYYYNNYYLMHLFHNVCSERCPRPLSLSFQTLYILPLPQKNIVRHALKVVNGAAPQLGDALAQLASVAPAAPLLAPCACSRPLRGYYYLCHVQRPATNAFSEGSDYATELGVSGVEAVREFLPHLLRVAPRENSTFRTDDFYAAQYMLRVQPMPADGETAAQVVRFQQDAAVPSDDTQGPASVERVAIQSKEKLDRLMGGVSGIQQQLKELFGPDDTRWSDWKLYEAERRPAVSTPQYVWRKFYITVNLYKNEAIIPFFTEALVAFLEDEVAPFFSVRDAVVVSIYSNEEPSDATALLIQEMLIPRLQKAGVEKIYSTVSGSCLGYRGRQGVHNRIEWLSCVRNKALEPLHDMGLRVFLDDPLSVPPDDRADEAGKREELVVLFFNDIFFWPRDITALLGSRPEPGIGVRFHQDGAAREGEYDEYPLPEESPPLMVGGFDMACAMDYYYTLYDMWVLRDMEGSPMANHPPYSEKREIQESFWRALGGAPECADADAPCRRYAIPVKSCWNGVAALRGSLFLPAVDASTRKRMDSFAGRHETRVPPLIPVVLGSRGLYQSKTGDDRVPDATAEWGQLARKQFPSVPLFVQRPSGAVLQLVGGKTHEDVADYWRDTVAVRLGSVWGRLLGQKREKYCSVYPNEDLCIVGPSYLLEMLRHPDNEEVQEFADRVREEALRPCKADLVYKEMYPVLRLRQAISPSYGAAVGNQATVTSDVCQSSECLLVAEDISQLTYIQERRAPVILLNPNVRVAYEPYHFSRLQRRSLRSPVYFRIAIRMYRVWTWILFLLGMDIDRSWRALPTRPPAASESWNPRQSVSVVDDWKLRNRDGEIDFIFSPFLKRWELVNITELTLMRCDILDIYVQSIWYRILRFLARSGPVIVVVFCVFALTPRTRCGSGCRRLLKKARERWHSSADPSQRQRRSKTNRRDLAGLVVGVPCNSNMTLWNGINPCTGCARVFPSCPLVSRDVLYRYDPPPDACAAEKALLSYAEQEEVLLQLASMLRTTLLFLRLVGIFQIVVALFYVGLLVRGMPPVFVEQVEDRDLLGRQFLPEGETLLTDNRQFGSGARPATMEEDLQRKAKESASDLDALLSFVARAQGLHSITPAGRLALLGSIILLAMGGWSCFKAGELLRVPPSALLAQSLAEDGVTHSTQEGEACLTVLVPAADTTSMLAYLKSFALHPLLNQRLWLALSLWPAGYWILALHVYNRNKNMLLEDVGSEGAFLYLGISSRLLDIILALWQPVFHGVTLWMIKSMVDARNELVDLSHLRYKKIYYEVWPSTFLGENAHDFPNKNSLSELLTQYWPATPRDCCSPVAYSFRALALLFFSFTETDTTPELTRHCAATRLHLFESGAIMKKQPATTTHSHKEDRSKSGKTTEPNKKPKKHDNNRKEDEKYVVVISNVENDFSKIHQDRLPLFLGLDPAYNLSAGASLHKIDPHHCCYNLKCRTETRSAELTVTGPAEAAMQSIFVQKKARNRATDEPTDAPEGTTADGGVQAVEDLHSSTGAESLESRVAALQRQPYFRRFLHFRVNIPGRDEGTVLHPGLRKRRRGAEDAAEASADADLMPVKQRCCSQQKLVSAVALLSTSWTTKELRTRLEDLPGFVSCWFLHARHFRVVFLDAESLFRAKKLLDEFEIEGKVRVSLQLSDFLQRLYEESLSTEQEAWAPAVGETAL
eukprot:gene4274-3091_t